MAAYDNGTGYIQIKLRKNKIRKSFYVHRLVYETFIGCIPDNMEINHMDFDKTNNSISNLEVVKHIDNVHHFYKNKYKYVLPIECERCGTKLSSGARRLCLSCYQKYEYKITKVDRNKLLNMLNLYNMSEAGRRLGVSHTTVRRWRKKYNI